MAQLVILSLVSILGVTAFGKEISSLSTTGNISEGSTGSTTTSSNHVADTILDHLSKYISRDAKTEILLADLKHSFRTKLSFLPVSGEFVTTKGRISGLSTFRRTGDATLKKEERKLILSAQFALQDLMSVYSYNISSSDGISRSGEIKMKPNSYSVNIQVDVTRKGALLWKQCTASLAEMNSKLVGNYQMEISNLTIYQSVENDIRQWVTGEVERVLQEYMNTVIQPKLKEAIVSAEICQTLKEE